MTVDIYALLDPETGKPRYVGQSKNVSARVQSHWRGRHSDPRAAHSNREVARWLSSLSAPPEYFVLESVPYEDRFKAERYYTDLLREIGLDLLNINSGSSHAVETRAKISNTLHGRPVSAQALAKAVEVNRGRKLPASQVAKRGEVKRASGPYANSASGFKGVGRDMETGRWRAAIWVNGKQKHLGRFDDAADAGRAYDVAARKFLGPDVFLNFPEERGAA